MKASGHASSKSNLQVFSPKLPSPNSSVAWGLVLVSRPLFKGLYLISDSEAFLLGLVSVTDWEFLWSRHVDTQPTL